ncbi:tetratricopeptide repeat protein [candidate division KSB1 bacterium]
MKTNFLKIISVAFISILLSSLSLNSQINTNYISEKNKIISEGLELVYSTDYDEAIAHFRKIDEIDPECVEALFFEAFVLELIMDVYRSQVYDDSFNVVVEKAVKKGEEAVEKNPTARNYMFLGGVYGVRGVRKGILGSWYGAAMDGRKANSNFEKSIKSDSELYDCYYGIGSYHYWKTKKLKRFFGFLIPDNREQGMKEIHLSIEKGIFAETPGRNALFRIYIEEKRFEDVEKLAELVLKDNPNHLFPLWYLGVSYIKTEQWQKALGVYQKIADYLPQITFHGPEADIETWYYTGLCYYNMKNNTRAREYFSKIPPYEGKVNKELFYYDDYVKKSKSYLKKIDQN